jgi:TPR repeat protein
LGGLKSGLLTIDAEGLTLEQRLSVAGGALLALSIFFGGAVLAAVASELFPGLLGKGASKGAQGATVLLILVLAVIAPVVAAIWIRRSRWRCALSEVVQSSARGREVEINFRAGAGVPGPSATGLEAADRLADLQTRRLVFTPVHSAGFSALVGALSASPGGVKDTLAEDKVEFARRLAAATPKAWVTPALLVLNVLMFLVLSADSNSLFSPPLPKLIAWGADFGPLTVTGQQWWRTIACCFLHVGLLHLLCNMLALFQAGQLVERLFGPWFFLLIYLGCGVSGSLASLWLNPALVSAGASGAIFGVYGALLAYFARERGGVPRGLVKPLVSGASVFVAWNLVYGLLSMIGHMSEEALNSAGQTSHSHGGVRIDMAAHAGGFVAGLILGFAGARPLEIGRRQAVTLRRGMALMVAAGVMTVLLLGAALGANPGGAANFKVLGGMFLRGEGVAINIPAAVAWFKQAAAQGDLASKKLLGSLYYRGEGVRRDIAEAARWFAKAGEEGDLEAEKTLGSMYFRGDGVAKNVAEGERWLRKAGERGDLETQRLLAGIYLRGDGVESNYLEGIKWLSKVADHGDLPAQKGLAATYYRGEGVEVDKAAAAKWYGLAAGQGDRLSQVMLGLMLANGEGMEKNPVEALKWLILSGETRPPVVAARQALERGLTPAEKQEADGLVRKFQRLSARR